jgi:hypothetical protein
MSPYDPSREALDYLLDLHRDTYEVGGGWWVTIRARRVEPSEERPHGLQYSLTLHNPRGQRIVGYDNAHALGVRSAPGQRARRKTIFDHRHYRHRRTAYEFRSPADLLVDFWRDVEAILEEEGVS